MYTYIFVCPSLPPRNIKGARNKLEKENHPIAIFLRVLFPGAYGFVPRIKESRSCLPPKKKGSFPVHPGMVLTEIL